MLLGERVASQRVYPLLQVRALDLADEREFLLSSCCFHDFWSSDHGELAGMGLAIIGNTVKFLREAEKQGRRFCVFCEFVAGPGVRPVPAPWPGMPDDNPMLPLSPEELPFESAMFFDDEQHLKKRVDRLALMARIEAVWVPWLRAKMGAEA